MDQIATGSVKESFDYYNDRFNILASSIRTFPTPRENDEYDRSIFDALGDLVHCKVPEITISSTDAKKFVATFKTRYVTDVWTLVDEIIEEQIVQNTSPILTETGKTVLVLEQAFNGLEKVLTSLDYYLSPILGNFRAIEGQSNFYCFEKYGTLKFADMLPQLGISSFDSLMKIIIRQTLAGFEQDNVALIKIFMKYDVLIDGNNTSSLFEEAATEVIAKFPFRKNHFENVLNFQKNVGYYCENHFSICQRLTMTSVYKLILDFDSLSSYLNFGGLIPLQVISMFAELREIILQYYPWRMKELAGFITSNISNILEEEKLTIFILKYSEWTQESKTDMVDESRKSLMEAISMDTKLLDKIAKWICQVSEKSFGVPLFSSTCTFLNNIFPQKSKYDEILWSIYRRKYFLRSLLKFTLTDSGSSTICKGERFDQRLLENGSLDSVHITDLKKLNREFQESLILRRVGAITPVILKQTNVLDYVDPTDISGLVLPDIFERVLGEQWKIFKEKGGGNEKKTLYIQPELNLIELKSTFKVGPSENFLMLQVNLVQACILTLFDSTPLLYLEEIKRKLTRDDEETSIIDKNVNLFAEISMIKMNENGQYYINKKYKPKPSALQGNTLILYHLPRISIKNNEQDKSDDAWYQELITACITRILKSRRKCTRSKLFELARLEYPALSFGEFKEALKNHRDYYKIQDGNYVYTT